MAYGRSSAKRQKVVLRFSRVAQRKEIVKTFQAEYTRLLRIADRVSPSWVEPEDVLMNAIYDCWQNAGRWEMQCVPAVIVQKMKHTGYRERMHARIRSATLDKTKSEIVEPKPALIRDRYRRGKLKYGFDVEAEMKTHSMRMIFDHMATQLKRDELMVVKYRFVAGYNNNQAAVVMGVPPAETDRILRRAMYKLRKMDHLKLMLQEATE